MPSSPVTSLLYSSLDFIIFIFNIYFLSAIDRRSTKSEYLCDVIISLMWPCRLEDHEI